MKNDDSGEKEAGHRRRASSQQMGLLPEGFVPGDDDVICGRGKKCYNHIGNERFRKRVLGMLDEYSNAKSKVDKSGVLATVVDQIRAASPNGGFVKQGEDGRWYEVGDFLAREKTSQCFRDALSEQYKSSSEYKKRRRQEEQAKATDRFQRMMRSQSANSSGMDWLSLSLSQAQSTGTSYMGADPLGLDVFHGTNFEIMARLNQLASSRQQQNRRFPPRHPALQRPNSAMAVRFPDPLFGHASANAFPSSGPVARSSSAPIDMRGRHAFSVPSSPRHEPQQFTSMFHEIDPLDLPTIPSADVVEQGAQEAMHNSMPNMMPSSSLDPFDFGALSLHSSTPNMHFSDSGHSNRDETASSDLDPIPWDEITPRPKKKSVAGEDFKKKPISMTLSPASPTAEEVSKDLMSCLEKLTGSSIKDDNPFEPLPLAQDANEQLDPERVSRDRKPSPEPKEA